MIIFPKSADIFNFWWFSDQEFIFFLLLKQFFTQISQFIGIKDLKFTQT